MRHRTKNSGGFTLVELLVVIAIIGILVSLILPAVGATRGMAHKVQCASNLKQLGLALHNHEANRGYFPPGYTSASTGNTASSARDAETWDAAPGWGWTSYLLPYLDAEHLADAISYDDPIWDPAHRETVSQTLPALLCPASLSETFSFTVAGDVQFASRWPGVHEGERCRGIGSIFGRCKTGVRLSPGNHPDPGFVTQVSGMLAEENRA